MKTQLLNDSWSLKIIGGDYLPATVPGSVYSDLLANGKMDDPFWRDNELKALKIMDNDFEYSTSFVPSKELIESDAVILRFDGIDTIADVSLNGISLGKTENMYRYYEYDVGDILVDGENQLVVKIYSPTKYIKEQYKITKVDGSTDAMVGFPTIRKAHCMFGWDWGPRLPDAGIWKDVKLLGINTARIDGVYVHQEHENGKVSLDIDVDVDCYSDDENIYYSAKLVSPDGEEYSDDDKDDVIEVSQPKLWWPNGYGDQPLYYLEIKLFCGDTIIDTWTKKIGLRTMTVKREKDEYGESFAHEVNGVSIFAMGADYIPEDNILSRVNKERTWNLVKQCKDANFNCIRVWGGGYYPSDDFYDACDYYGMVVWQDMMFACAAYELTEDFALNIQEEIRQNVRRIRNHASLGLWCGNNEMEMFFDFGAMVGSPKQKADYIRMYEYLIPIVCRDNDPDTFYWCASPSSGGGFDKPNDPTRGDVHYWDVWHGSKPFTDYRKQNFRYLSEFGFESFPSVKTIESFTEPEDRNVFSYIMDKHQRCFGANGKIITYLSQTYKYPNSFDMVVYASQLLQAEGIKYGVEHFRRIRGICMGAIYWQLNDCWPVASWASIDYFGRWKALHYYAKRFFAPLMLSCSEEGMLTQNTNINCEPYEMKKSIKLCIANETREDRVLTVKWALRSADASIIRQGSFDKVKSAQLSSAWLDEIEFPEADEYNNYVSYELYNEDNELISDSTVLFSVPKYFNYVDPKLTVEKSGDEIIVKSSAYAKSVMICGGDDDLILSDNFFDINAGERRVKIISGNSDNLSVKSVYDIK